MDKLFSIVIPVYNGEKHLRGMLDSLIRVQFPLMEILLVDDGSTDSSASIIAEYVQQDSRIDYIYEDNAGIVEARNHGLRLAKGKYVCFFDQDDFVNLDVYVDLLEKMQSENAQVGICNTGRYVRGNKSDYEKIREAVYKDYEVKRGLLYPLLFRGYACNFADERNYLYGTVWKCIFDRDFLVTNQIQFKRFVSYEDDWIFVTTALTKADIVVSVAEVGYYWRINDSSESHTGKYIDNICEKLKQLDECVSAYLYEAMDEEEWSLYQKVREVDHLMEYLTNEWNGRKGAKVVKTIWESHMNLERYLLPKTGIRKKIVLHAMNGYGIKAAYFLNGIVLFWEKKCSKVNVFVWLERRSKWKNRSKDIVR